MKATIDRDLCIGCEVCADTCPNVFRMNDDGLAEVYVDTIAPEDEDTAKAAESNCPVNIITVE